MINYCKILILSTLFICCHILNAEEVKECQEGEDILNENSDNIYRNNKFETSNRRYDFKLVKGKIYYRLRDDYKEMMDSLEDVSKTIESLSKKYKKG